MRKVAVIILVLSHICLFSQGSLEITFTGELSDQNVRLDSIWVNNLSQGGDTILYFPDTVLSLLSTGVAGHNHKAGFSLSQNYPNPYFDKTSFSILMKEEGTVRLLLSGIHGQFLIVKDILCFPGENYFTLSGGAENIYVLSALYNNHAESIKLLSSSAQSGHQIQLSSTGNLNSSNLVSSRLSVAGGFVFTPGDNLQYIGYSGYGVDTIVYQPQSSAVVTFMFTQGTPCPGLPEIDHDGQVYNTVQIGDQCWLRENLNVGIRIDSTQNQTDNSIIEKYCYKDIETNCDFYGGMYQWNELMNYTSQQGAQGICPEGWHVPTEAEYLILQAFLGGEEYAGGKMKEAGYEHWTEPNIGATNYSGFTGLPSGIWFLGLYESIGAGTILITSTDLGSGKAASFLLWTGDEALDDEVSEKSDGNSLRCVKN